MAVTACGVCGACDKNVGVHMGVAVEVCLNGLVVRYRLADTEVFLTCWLSSGSAGL